MLKLTSFREKYGMELNEALQSGLTGPDTIPNLVNSLPPEKLGLLMILMSDINKISPDLGNFMSYDTERMQGVREKILSISKKLNDIVGDR